MYGGGGIRAGCLGEEALKMVKGQRPRENLALSASPAKLNTDMLKRTVGFKLCFRSLFCDGLYSSIWRNSR